MDRIHLQWVDSLMGTVQLLLIIGCGIIEDGVPVGQQFHGTALDVDGDPGVAEYPQGAQSSHQDLQEGAHVQDQDIFTETGGNRG